MEKPIIPQNLLNKLNEDENFQAFIQNAPKQEQATLSAGQRSLLINLNENLIQLQAILRENEE